MIDALGAWQSLRSSLAWSNFPDIAGPLVGVRDGHRHFLDTFVQRRDPARAARLHDALSRVRADALRGLPLDFGQLSAWHEIILPDSSHAFRHRDAFAKHGREKYGFDPQTPTQFSACLRDADSSQIPLTARATRSYLDVSFFHPFCDGNARIAALSLDFILTRAGIILDQVSPLFLVSRPADAATSATSFAQLLNTLTRATRERAMNSASTSKWVDGHESQLIPSEPSASRSG